MKYIYLLFFILLTAFTGLAAEELKLPQNPEVVADSDTKLKSAAADLLVWMKDTAQKGDVFVAAQSPLLVQEYLDWVFWSNVWAIFAWTFCFIMAVLCFLWTKRWARWSQVDSSPENCIAVLNIISIVVCVAMLIVSCLLIPQSASNILQVKVAPRVVIVEKFSNFLKK